MGRRLVYTLVYRYSYNGSSYARDEEVESEVYYTVNIGDVVGVRCLPEQPKIARLEYNLTESPSNVLGALPKELVTPDSTYQIKTSHKVAQYLQYQQPPQYPPQPYQPRQD